MSNAPDSEDQLVRSDDLDADIARFVADGFRLEMITPADSPRIAELSRGGERIRLVIGDSVDADLRSAVVFDDEFVLTQGPRADVAGDLGRAGMQYRDLIPNRHGGHVIASHIIIPGAGPVADYVHHHDINFQVIFVKSGQVKVVYEDQGDPFWMGPGDCVLQPPHIRHRVLESADDCEVIEVASPAEHPTFVEHKITLPTAIVDAARDFGGQRFHFDEASAVEWSQVGEGWTERVLGIGAASGGAGAVRVLRTGDQRTGQGGVPVRNDGTLCLLFVLEGECMFDSDLGGGAHEVRAGDALAIPNGATWTLRDDHSQCSVLQITMA